MNILDIKKKSYVLEGLMNLKVPLLIIINNDHIN